MTQEDFERLDAAIDTIKRLMPEVEKTIRKAKAIVNYKELPTSKQCKRKTTKRRK